MRERFAMKMREKSRELSVTKRREKMVMNLLQVQKIFFVCFPSLTQQCLTFYQNSLHNVYSLPMVIFVLSSFRRYISFHVISFYILYHPFYLTLTSFSPERKNKFSKYIEIPSIFISKQERKKKRD